MARRRITRTAEVSAAADELFESAPAQKQAAAEEESGERPRPWNGPIPSLPDKLGRITETVFSPDVDPEAEFEVLRGELALNEALTPNNVRAALNRVHDNALRAHRIYIMAKVAHARLKIDMDVVVGAMRSDAMRELQKEKDSGQRSKAITNADVDERAAIMWPDEWVDANERAVRAEQMVEHLKRLADLWQERSYSLGKMKE